MRWIFVWLAIASCGHRQAAKESSKPQVAAPLAGQRPTFFVGSKDGIVEMTYDGAVVRSVTKTVGGMPRFAHGGKDLAFLVGHEKELELRIVTIDTGAERSLARFGTDPDSYCPGIGGPNELTPQSDHDFVIDDNGNACVELMDRNLNMADIGVFFRIDLVTGKILERQAKPCNVDWGNVPDCFLYRPPKPPLRTDFPFKLEKNELRREGVTVTTLAADDEFTQDATSPSGRYVVLSGNLEEGDSIYRQAVILDREEGRLYLITKAGSLRLLSNESLLHFRREDLARLDARDVVGESTIRWLDGDRLIVENLLFDMDGHVLELPGSVAK